MCFPAQVSAVIEPSFLFRSISSEMSIVADVLADEERRLSLCGVGERDAESFLLLLEAMATAKKVWQSKDTDQTINNCLYDSQREKAMQASIYVIEMAPRCKDSCIKNYTRPSVMVYIGITGSNLA